MRVIRVTWRDCISRYDRPHALFCRDPGYWQAAGYGVAFPFGEYEQMAAAMRTCAGRAVPGDAVKCRLRRGHPLREQRPCRIRRKMNE